MTGHRRRGPAALVLITAVLVPGPLTGQWEWLPDGELPTLIVAPREPQMGIRLLGMAKGASAFGPGVEWDANFGGMLPLIRFSGEDPRHAVTLGVQAGVFGRFALETKKRDLISSDWIFVAPVFITRGDHWIRVRYRHISAHLGDDYIDRFDVGPEGYLRDDFGILVYRQVSRELGVYGGGSYAWNVDPNVNKRAALQAGFEVNRRRVTSAPWYAGLDVAVDQDASWTPRFNFQVGAWIAESENHALRLTLEALTGASPQGQFRRSKATYVGVGIVVEL